jgi:copper chaperone NosL
MLKILSFSFLLFFFLACEVAPVAIEYNVDQCSACKMMIADAQFGSELVTTKGKVFKYDAIECLVPEVNTKGELHFAFILVSNFNQPANLIDARNAYFVVSKSRPSPMGGFLSAYVSESEAKTALAEVGGELYDWNALLKMKRYAQGSKE